MTGSKMNIFQKDISTQLSINCFNSIKDIEAIIIFDLNLMPGNLATREYKKAISMGYKEWKKRK